MILKQGSRGSAVTSLQRKLNLAMRSKLITDGIFGAGTKAVVVEYQMTRKLVADGIVGPATFTMLDAETTQPFVGISKEELIDILGLTPSLAEELATPLSVAMLEFRIDTRMRAACFIANVAHECGNFTTFSENLNYSAEGLARTWPNRYATSNGSPNDLALSIARNPELIANHTYAERMGNGSVASGDGYNYRGRGPIMVTGKDNYIRMGDGIGIDLIAAPELLEGLEQGCRSSAYFWLDNGINVYADKGDFDGVCDKVNIGRKTEKHGDSIGFKERSRLFDKARAVLMV